MKLVVITLLAMMLAFVPWLVGGGGTGVDESGGLGVSTHDMGTHDVSTHVCVQEGVAEPEGCDPFGPVRVRVQRDGNTMRIETSATLAYRGDLRVTTRLPEGVRWVDDAGNWIGEGVRTLRFTGDAGGVPGEVKVTMLSVDGETFVDQTALVFADALDAGVRVKDARLIEGGTLMAIPATIRPGGGR